MPYWEGIDLSFHPLMEKYRNTRFYMERILKELHAAEASAEQIEKALRRMEREQRAQERSRKA